MKAKVFPDTNIIPDILDDQRPFSTASLQLWQQVEDDDINAKRLSILSGLLDFVEVLPCNTIICQKAIQSNFPDFEGAVLYQPALENGMNYFITNDSKALRKRGAPLLPLLTAAEFLKASR